jgi:hypothetical protein
VSGAASPGDDGASAGEVAHAALRGVIGAMSMSGMRKVTESLGLVDQTPPQAIIRQRVSGILRLVPRRQRRTAIELAHWSYGGVGGAGFGLLPDAMRKQRWAGPAYGLALWFGFELGIAPVLGLSQAKRPRPVERLALAADHLLYGLVLSEFRPRPHEDSGGAPQ